METVLSRATKRNERNPGWVNISLDWYTANRWVDCGGGYSLRVGAVKGLRGKRVRFKGRGSLVVTQNVIGVGGDERFEFGNFEVITTGDGSGDISVSLEEETLQQIKTSLHRPSQFGWKAEIFFFVEEVSGPATDQTSLTVELTTVP